MPGSAKTRRNTIERAERLCQPISERFGVSSVRQLKAKHLRWALETWAATKSSQTRYDYWRTARCIAAALGRDEDWRSEEHTSELQSLMSNSYAVFCLKKK